MNVSSSVSGDAQGVPFRRFRQGPGTLSGTLRRRHGADRLPCLFPRGPLLRKQALRLTSVERP